MVKIFFRKTILMAKAQLSARFVHPLEQHKTIAIRRMERIEVGKRAKAV
jgi:hypothetical protein